MAEAGRKTILDKELLAKIKESILFGNDLKTTANVCEISESTLYTWTSDNYLNLADKIDGWKRDRKLKLAEMNLEAIMCLGISDKESIKVVADVSKFVAETLGKQSYSKRTEQTGADGKDLIPSPIVKLSDILGNDSSTQNSTAQ
jgi:hypothetical protein